MNSPPDTIAPIDLGNLVELSMRQLAELVLAKTGSKSELRFGPLPEDDPRQRQPDIGKARQLPGWELTTPLADGHDHIIAYFRERVSGRS